MASFDPRPFVRVSRARFYALMGPPLNVHPSPEGEWPYTSKFKTPLGVCYGEIRPIPHPYSPTMVSGETFWVMPSLLTPSADAS
jgi:hypothetical protein